MQIGPSGQFHFSEIFGGTLKEQTTCRLELLGGYSLIYAEVENLEVLEALYQAFDLNLGDRPLMLASAGFFIYSAPAGGLPPVSLKTQFPGSPVPDTVAAKAMPVVDTTSFWLKSDLGGDRNDGGLFASLADIRVATGTSLALSAPFAKGKHAGDASRTAIDVATVDGTIQLFDRFTFTDVRVGYSVGTVSRLAVAGTIGVDRVRAGVDERMVAAADGPARGWRKRWLVPCNGLWSRYETLPRRRSRCRARPSTWIVRGSLNVAGDAGSECPRSRSGPSYSGLCEGVGHVHADAVRYRQDRRRVQAGGR